MHVEVRSTRERIVESADRLFYESGYGGSSFASVAAEVGISKGNFHHHFKAKDDILAEVIERRRAATAAMLERWELADPSPEAQLRSFIEMVRVNRADIVRHGCPVGTLCSELAKDDHALLGAARSIVELFCEWLAARFVALGCGTRSRARAEHLFVLSQGVALVANVTQDPDLLEREVDEMHRWLDEIVGRDPFVEHGVATPTGVEIVPSRVSPALAEGPR